MSDIKKFMKENRLEEVAVSQYYTLEGDTLLCKSTTIQPLKTATSWIPITTQLEEVDDNPRCLPVPNLLPPKGEFPSKEVETKIGLWDAGEKRKWHEIAKKMPFMEVPEGYEIAIIPPFSAADARFWVKRPDERVISVYADFYDSLGYEGKPYWEVYPCVDGETGRCEIDDIK